MKLVYFSSHPNFGDMLNPWLWPQIMPDVLDEDDDDLFLGIGSILWSGYPQTPRKHVFGSGYRGGPSPSIDEKWDFRFVRGPLTAGYFRLPPAKVISDPAILLHSVWKPSQRTNGSGRVSFVPHWTHDERQYAEICARNNVQYISPLNENVEDVLVAIHNSGLVIAEALHGAIVADALRVPWIPVDFYGVHHFKWRDWCLSLCLEYRVLQWGARLPRIFRKMVRRGVGQVAKLDAAYFEMMLKRAVTNGSATLSNQDVLNRTLHRLWIEVEQFQHEFSC